MPTCDYAWSRFSDFERERKTVRQKEQESNRKKKSKLEILRKRKKIREKERELNNGERVITALNKMIAQLFNVRRVDEIFFFSFSLSLEISDKASLDSRCNGKWLFFCLAFLSSSSSSSSFRILLLEFFF